MVGVNNSELNAEELENIGAKHSCIDRVCNGMQLWIRYNVAHMIKLLYLPRGLEHSAHTHAHTHT